MFKGYDRIVLFDTETTGLDFEKCQVIELGMMVIDRIDGSLKLVQEYDQFVELFSTDKLPEKIVELTHITDDMLKEKGIPEKQIAEDFYKAIGDKSKKTIVVAHNTQFDLNFMYQTLKRHYDDAYSIIEACDYLDTLTVYKDRKEYPHTLEDAIKHYGLEGQVVNSHRAVDDTKALVQVTNKMCHERDDLDEYINVFGYNPKYNISGIPFDFIKYAKQFYNNSMVSPDRILPRKI